MEKDEVIVAGDDVGKVHEAVAMLQETRAVQQLASSEPSSVTVSSGHVAILKQKTSPDQHF